MTGAHSRTRPDRTTILAASPEKLVTLLYDSAIRHLEDGCAGLQDPKAARSPEVGRALSRATGILGELRASLDHEAGGQIARDLDRLYEWALDQLSQAALTRTPGGADSALQVMRTLKEGWDGVIPG